MGHLIISNNAGKTIKCIEMEDETLANVAIVQVQFKSEGFSWMRFMDKWTGESQRLL